MGCLSDDLRRMGFIPTGESSPVDKSGVLWTNGHEIVCDASGTVIDGNHHVPDSADVETQNGVRVYRYQNSGNVKMVGGYIGSYDWGYDDERIFEY